MGQIQQILDSEVKYWTARGNIGKILDRDGKYWTETRNIGRKGELIDIEGKY